MTDLKIETLVVPPVYSNCYLVTNTAGETVVIDPGGIEKDIIASIERQNLNVIAILNTHGHVDHISANPAVRRHTGAPIYVHPKDAEMLGSGLLCGADWMGIVFEEHKHDVLFEVGEMWLGTGFRLEIVHTPGHSPGSVSIILPEHKIIFPGDVLFMDSIGRSDLPGGNSAVLNESLRQLLKLPDDFTVYPGHGTRTSIGREKILNPFLQRL